MILTDDAKNAMLQGLADLLNAGNGSVLSLYVDTTLAVELTMENPIEFSIAGGVMTFNKPADALAVASGVPTSAQLLDSSGAIVASYTADEILINKPTIYQGGYVGIDSLKVSI